MDFYQHLVTIRLRLHLFHVRLRFGLRRLGAVKNRLQRRGINSEQNIARLYVRTLAINLIQQNSRHPRPHFRRPNRGNPSRQFRRHRQRFHCDRLDSHLRRWRRKSDRLFPAARGCHRPGCQPGDPKNCNFARRKKPSFDLIHFGNIVGKPNVKPVPLSLRP